MTISRIIVWGGPSANSRALAGLFTFIILIFIGHTQLQPDQEKGMDEPK